MRRGRPKAVLELTTDERAALARWARREAPDTGLAVRARIVLACATGATNKDVADLLEVWPHTVSKWRSRFVRDRLAGLADEPRPGAVRKLSAAQVAEIVERTLEEAPAAGDSHWSTRSMARAVRLNQTAISRIWRAHGLRPHEIDTWRLFGPHRPGGGCGLAGIHLAAGCRVLALAIVPRPLPVSVPAVPLPAALVSLLTVAGRASGPPDQRRRGVTDFLDMVAGGAPEGVALHLAFAGRDAEHAAVRSWLARHPAVTVHPVPSLASWHRLRDRWVAGLVPHARGRLLAGLEEWCEAGGGAPFVWPGTRPSSAPGILLPAAAAGRAAAARGAVLAGPVSGSAGR
ncbi:helix-turn-helix domain-containing protein [Actinoplanes sp. RD1]|uniref:helix-turn-helix domain-containing protein n=1 Tax=Actinoplanes sp. RD1 TaxID=3064538 RepID=UPI0027426E82|nr:helix-turn-helix domain-containing protein [Actinoplanes sp. RD1]